jgi:hypothetical protein
MQLVLHASAVGESQAPVMEPLSEGRMRVKWALPEDAKSTTVKLRRAGRRDWVLCGGAALPEGLTETVANGLEEGIEYEAMVEFLVHGQWCCQSPVSKPVCIGELKLPGQPGAPKEPRLWVVDQLNGTLKVKWQLATEVPPIQGAVVKIRSLGLREWHYVVPSTWQVAAEPPADIVPVPCREVEVTGLTQGVRYEAVVAFKNKLGQGPDSPLSSVACLGRPHPRLVRCTYCFKEFDLEHATYTRSPDCFWCLPCRFRHMDPFNALVEKSGMLVSQFVTRPTMSFTLDVPELKAWRKDDHAVFMRMVKIDSDTCAQVWPKKLRLEANGHEVFNIKEPEEGHVRRDVPMNIVASLRPGGHRIKIEYEDDYLPGYAMALVRTKTQNAQQIAKETPICDEEAARERVMALLAETWAADKVKEDEEEDEDITIVMSNKLKLRCPLSFERVVIPVRGETCVHLQCFGLGAYLESNMKMRAMNNRWTCPVCTNVLKPLDLRVDAYVEKVLAETPPHIDEVQIMEDGSYRCIEEEADEKGRGPTAEGPSSASATAPEESARMALQRLAEGEEEGLEMKELPTTIDDGEAALGRRRATQAFVASGDALKPPLAKRQRRRKRMLNVTQDEEESA